MITVLEEPAPVYRALWWNEQDRQNRHWIDDASRLVREYGQTLASDRVDLPNPMADGKNFGSSRVLCKLGGRLHTNSTLIMVTSGTQRKTAQ